MRMRYMRTDRRLGSQENKKGMIQYRPRYNKRPELSIEPPALLLSDVSSTCCCNSSWSERIFVRHLASLLLSETAATPSVPTTWRASPWQVGVPLRSDGFYATASIESCSRPRPRSGSEPMQQPRRGCLLQPSGICPTANLEGYPVSGRGTAHAFLRRGREGAQVLRSRTCG